LYLKPHGITIKTNYAPSGDDSKGETGEFCKWLKELHGIYS